MSRAIFVLLVAAVIAERLLELRRARRNRTRALAAGGIELGAGHYPVMVAIHSAYLAACLAEVLVLKPPFRPLLAVVAGSTLAATMALRVWVIRSLGDAWNVRVIVVPGRPLVKTGPYRWLRHPNYLAVLFEIPALPLVHSAWRTALLFSLLNALILAVRVRVENRALAAVELR